MKPGKNERLIPIESLLRKGKWDEYCRIANISDALRQSIKKYPEKYDGVCLYMPEETADKLGFIFKI